MADTTENCEDDDIGVLMPNVMKLLHEEINSEVSSVLQDSIASFSNEFGLDFLSSVDLISIDLAEEC